MKNEEYELKRLAFDSYYNSIKAKKEEPLVTRYNNKFKTYTGQEINLETAINMLEKQAQKKVNFSF